MTVEKTDTLVIGAGQAGVAMSEHLSSYKIPHIVLERNRIAEKWRTGRWDSLVANGPAWHDKFPGLEFSNISKDSFAKKESIADYFVEYAKKYNAPIREGVEVIKVERNKNLPGFIVETSEGIIEAQRVVSATGAFQTPVIPPIAPKDESLYQIHSAAYKKPEQLPDGAVLVVGAGSSGAQIAEELMRSGKKVFLSTGPHDRPPRSYRNRDFCWWLGVLGKWDAAAMAPGTEHVTIAVSGARGGKTIDFREFANQGMTLVGLTKSFENGKITFQEDLLTNLKNGDDNYLSLLDEADAYILENNLDLPEEPDARKVFEDAESIKKPILELDIKESGITSIIWATGFASDYSWLKINALDENNKPQHHRGVTQESGFYFLGLPWLSRRGSSFIWGVWHDAKYIADHIEIQRQYMTYHNSAK